MGMSRRKLREAIFLLLFRAEFHASDDLADQVDLFFEERGQVEETDALYIRTKFAAIMADLPWLDDQIREVCEGWRLTRLGKPELAILRLAAYEILKDEDIPSGVAINEAVELARHYSSEEAPRFVNGVLAKLV